MKRILLALLLLPALASGAANDMVMTQRNATDTGQLTRIVAHPAGVTDGLLGYNGATQLPVYFAYGSRLTLLSGVLDAAPQDWSIITGKPTIPAAQVQTDWSAASGIGVLLNKPTTIAGYGLTDAASLTQLAVKFDSPSGTTAQYLRGDGSTATFPSIPAAQVQTDWNASSGLGVLLNKPTTVAGYGISDAATDSELAAGLATKFNTPTGSTAQYLRGDGSTATFPTIPAAQVNSDWNAVSGISQVLNKPSLAAVATSGAYADLTGKPTLTSGTVTSITAGTGLSGGVITSSGTISLPNTGTAGSYSDVTTDAQGRVTSGTVRAQSSATRALNTAFQVNATRDAWASYSIQITVTASIAGGQNGDVILEIATNSGFTTGVQTLAIGGVGQTYTLAIALQGVQPQTTVVSGFIPAGYYARLRTVNNTGTPGFSYRVGQEALF